MIVSKVVISSQFKKAFKKLKNDHKDDAIKEIVDVCDKLIEGTLTTQNDNYSLNKSYKGDDGVKDVHISGGRYILLYRYDTDNETLIISLKLNNIVDHKELNKKLSKKNQTSQVYTTYDRKSNDISDYIDK